MNYSKLSEHARDPKTAALVGAATGAIKGVLVGIAVGKLAFCVILGVIGGAATGAVMSKVLRNRTENGGPALVPIFSARKAHE